MGRPRPLGFMRQRTREETAHRQKEPPEKQEFAPCLELTQLMFLKAAVERPLNIQGMGWGPQNDHALGMGLS